MQSLKAEMELWFHRHKLNQQKFAKLMKVTQAAVSHWVNSESPELHELCIARMKTVAPTCPILKGVKVK